MSKNFLLIVAFFSIILIISSLSLQKYFLSGLFSQNLAVAMFLTVIRLISFMGAFSQSLHLFIICLILFEIRKRFKNLKISLNFKSSNIKIVSKSFAQLCDLIEIFNRIFIMPILIFITQLIIGTTFTLFDIFSTISSANMLSENINYSILTLQWWLLMNIQIIFFICCCGLTLTEAKNFRKNLYKNLRVVKSLKERKKFEILILQVKHNEIKFSCGIFEFKWETIQMVRKFN
jgi:hypothetical protein